MKIRWSPEAAEHLSEIHSYLELHRPSLANSTIHELFEGISTLEHVPYRGRPGKRPSTRELVFPGLPYIALYRIKDDHVEIIRIRHTSRRPLLH